MLEHKANRKLMIIAIMLVCLLIPSIVFATTYSSTLSMAYGFTGATRSYSAGTMSISMTASSPTAFTGTTTFYVTCKQAVSGVDKKIGSQKTFKSNRNGVYNSGSFGKVSKGSYYFVFGTGGGSVPTITSKNVTMKTS